MSDTFLLGLGVFCEFVPVSSSAHFWLLQWLCDIHVSQQALLLAHLVPLVVLVVYFIPVWIGGFHDILASMKKRTLVGHAKVLACVSVSVMPLVVVGAWKYYGGWELETLLGLNEGRLIGASFVLFGTALLLADRWAPERKQWKNFDAKSALILGTAQCFALLSGASRLGLAITAARCMGYNRQASLTLGLLTGVPVLLGAQVLHAGDVWGYYKQLSCEYWLWPLMFAGLGLGFALLLMRCRGYALVALYRVIAGFLILMVV